MGPPNDPPKWFRLNSGFSGLDVNALSSHLKASRLSFRKNSKALPWNAFVPDLVTALITAPGLVGYSAD